MSAEMFRNNLESARAHLAEARANRNEAVGKLANAHHTVRASTLAVFDEQIQTWEDAVDNFKWMLQHKYGEVVD
ncbi:MULTISPECIES: hypothetical protein [unclassified Gordonia (in: high G+C Gram-positive bacteria)]|uniref:hypothetical protein n=1 Tax=unclassified Gordonia (in: high G+C Gram-positive bacteria) TaxID=2657482 RepID=UPI001966A5EE|nr:MULTISPECIES: hypothetical protein [unclassified Gordonia (in: high G+C Gram-positive bacteria)]MBN0974580.1 hypothetical protein [Gordonia sp. BP-119]MBN0984378.1 hypothetical protein [Gordonia sp. BP-94]